MDIQYNGAVIVAEMGEMSDVHNLMCECGHPLSSHSYVPFFYYPDSLHFTVYSSQCIACGFTEDKKDFVCKKFRIEK